MRLRLPALDGGTGLAICNYIEILGSLNLGEQIGAIHREIPSAVKTIHPALTPGVHAGGRQNRD